MNYSQKELSIERHHKSALQSKVTELESQVVSAKRELEELECDAKEKLTTAGDHVKQTRQEVSGLKAKVGKVMSGNEAWCTMLEKIVMFSL